MPEPTSVSAPPLSPGGASVAFVHAGDYVNKLNGQRIERECLLRLEAGCRALVINFRGTELVNSIGVSILLGVIEAAAERDARVVFSSVNRHTAQLFDLLGLTRHVALADSDEAALAALEEVAAAPQGH